MPVSVLDLFTEFRTFANGRDGTLGITGASLLAALAHFGLSHLDPQQKASWRERILAGRPYSAAERVGILDYCASDAIALEHLLPALASRLQSRPHWLEHALLRGRYMRAVATMEHRGVPVDAPLLGRLAGAWEPIRAGLIDAIRAEYPIFERTSLRLDRFEAWLAERGIPWPRTETGRLSLAEDTLRTMERAYPIVAPIRELRGNLGKLRLTDLAVGRDGRNRCMLSPFRARSGRNAPSASRFIFAPSVWLRSLIRPEPGRALAYIDFTSQEIAVAAALSGDAAMLRAYQSGDPYLAFAIEAKLAPVGATKATHKCVRDRCKALVLGTLYGMGEQTLAGNLNVPVAEARSLLRAHRRTYSRFWEWSQAAVDSGMLSGYLDTCFGWRLHVTSATRPTSLLNHPMQSHGAEMLRLACSFLAEAGVELCAPVHDAVLIEAPASELETAVAEARKLMARASRVVLAGVEVGTDAAVVRYPDRYVDPRGVDMWGRVRALLGRIEGEQARLSA
jgi:DNA polymerase I-like protein with 3'-5' exonuclease and polymerase domains